MKVSIIVDDFRLKSNSSFNQTSIFTEKSFFYKMLGFTQSLFYPLDIDGFKQLIAGSYRSNKPINIAGIDKILIKADWIQGSIVNGIGEATL